MGKLETFLKSNWFEAFSAQSIETVYKRGEPYTLYGDKLTTVGLVMSGQAREVAYSINGEETWVGEYKEGQFIGLVSLLTQQEHDFEIRAMANLTVKSLSQDKLLTLMRADMSLCEVIAADLAARLSASTSDLIDIHTLSVKGRVCAELMRLSLPIGITPGHHIIRPSPVFVELARRLNSTRETVSRTVSELQQKGIVSREPGAFVIKDPVKLRETMEHI